MGNKKTPLLQKLRNIGGTLYVFPSATEDIGLNLQSTTTGVAMSHFALLNIPHISNNKCLSNTQRTDITARDGNESLAMSLQNYAMNFETHLINEENYNYQKLETVSEKVFWHWANHIGIINLNSSGISSVPNVDNVYIEKEYNEDGNIANQDNTVIKCFGAIDAGNSLSTEFGMFNETYINIPTSWGAGPVFLKRSNDENFTLGKTYSVNNANHLEGRDDEYEYYSYTNGQDYPFFDIDEQSSHQYVIDSNYDGFEILKDINQIQTAVRSQFNDDEILLDSYDDINIDVQNKMNVDQQFEFNTILLYYSVYDQDDLVKTAYATNLFGVIFLDGAQFDQTPSENEQNFTFYIPPILKRKSTTTQFGNSYSFRVNLKTMSVYDNTDAIIQDNTTMSAISAVEFSDAISNMNRAIDIMNSNLTTVTAIQDQYAAIINYYDNFNDDLQDISICLNAYLKGTRSSFIDTSVVYANEIRTSESQDNFTNNTLLIKTHTDTLDINGNIIYNEPVVFIKNDDVTVPILHNSSMWTTKQYVVVNQNVNLDLDISNDASIINNNLFIERCNTTINNAFDQEKGFKIKLKIEPGTSTDKVSYNELYIDPLSPIFQNSEDNTNLKCLLDNDTNINYNGIIPYLIAEIMKMRKLLIDASIYSNS